MPTVYDSMPSGNLPPRKDIHPHQTIPMQPLAAFAVSPEGVRFETQEAEETVEIFLRQHPVVNVSWIVTSALLLAAPTAILPLILRILPLPFTIPPGYIIVGTAFWYLATFGFILSNFLHWFFNIYIVTNERVVDIDFYYLLYKHFAEAELDKIQDISYSSSGLLATLFDYGNVKIQTAAEIPNLEFELIPHPEKVVETIRSLVEKIEQRRRGI